MKIFSVLVVIHLLAILSPSFLPVLLALLALLALLFLQFTNLRLFTLITPLSFCAANWLHLGPLSAWLFSLQPWREVRLSLGNPLAQVVAIFVEVTGVAWHVPLHVLDALCGGVHDEARVLRPSDRQVLSCYGEFDEKRSNTNISIESDRTVRILVGVA
jgi:hypothetical protein